MKKVIVLAFFGAVVLHAAILLLGGLVLFPGKKAADTTAEVDLLSAGPPPVRQASGSGRDRHRRGARDGGRARIARRTPL